MVDLQYGQVPKNFSFFTFDFSSSFFSLAETFIAKASVGYVETSSPVYLFVNDHKEYTVSVFLEKRNSEGELFSGGGSWSPQLEQLIKEKNQ